MMCNNYTEKYLTEITKFVYYYAILKILFINWPNKLFNKYEKI